MLRQHHHRFPARLPGLILTLLVSLPLTAQAHFMWLVPTSDEKIADQSVHLIFSELASVPEADLLKLVEQVEVRQLSGKQLSDKLPLSKTDAGLLVKTAGSPSPLFVAEKVFGVRERAGKSFLLQYFAKSYVGREHPLWPDSGTVPGWKLEALPSINGNSATLHCTWNNHPLPGAEIVVQLDGDSSIEGKTNDNGDFTFSFEKQYLIAARIKHVEPVGGELDGKKFEETRHYLTVTFDNPTGTEKPLATSPSTDPFPEIPLGVTSFGAAILADDLYFYGGNIGKSHDYFVGTQSDKLFRLKLAPEQHWEELAPSTPLQGVALVACSGKLYRAGGFTAKNLQGEKQDLFSTNEFASFDPQTGNWTNYPPLPEPRSSHDMAILGDTLYVVGGWSMQGNANKSHWHKTAWTYDLKLGTSGTWNEIPQPPSVRRALTLAAHAGKMYAIGGMEETGSTTTETAVYNPVDRSWTYGPDLPGDEGDGFGASAFAVGGRLYVTGIAGKLYRLSEDGEKWEAAGDMLHKRFFHRMLPMHDGNLLLVGGSDKKRGKVRELEILTTP